MAKKIGFAFSGGAARIAQECALTEALVEGLMPQGRKIRPSVLAGTSSGALNAVATNAVIRSKEKDDSPSFTWEDYKQILFSLSDGKIFDISPIGLTKIIARNISEGFMLDTTPLRNLLEDIIVHRMGFTTLGNLYIPTYISVVELESGRTRRLYSHSDDESIRNLPLVDVLMATTAIPVAFKPVKIRGLEGEFIDGGTGRDGIPVQALCSEKCKEIYLISRMRGDEVMVNLKEFKKPKILLNTLLAMEYLLDALFETEVYVAPHLAKKAYLYIPDLPRQYPLLDFGNQEEQYKKTMEWAKKNDPVKLKKNRKFYKLL